MEVYVGQSGFARVTHKSPDEYLPDTLSHHPIAIFAELDALLRALPEMPTPADISAMKAVLTTIAIQVELIRLALEIQDATGDAICDLSDGLA